MDVLFEGPSYAVLVLRGRGARRVPAIPVFTAPAKRAARVHPSHHRALDNMFGAHQRAAPHHRHRYHSARRTPVLYFLGL
jgi:hypothetical protein